MPLRLILITLCLALILALLMMFAARFHPRRTSPPMILTLEAVQELAELVTLRIPFQTLVETSHQGHSGSSHALVLVHGHTLIGADLAAARLTRSESPSPGRPVDLILPAPRVLSCEVNHAKSRVIQVHRRGLWHAAPGHAGEATLIARAFEQTQSEMTRAAATDPHLDHARRQAEKIIQDLADRTGNIIEITWMP